ncbi:glycosyltransferase [Scytonema millei VB511283]|uniref:Glycosyltransferase n=2 Tax=Scytonema TaxID=1203 RepID=A0A9X5I407_9CYAN|nr:glycosyltransferase [Scytonema millei VB511283]
MTPETSKRPIWSIMIPTYERSRYLSEAIESVLAQTSERELDRFQIEVVDNCSTNKAIESIVSQYKGKVSFYRQPKTVDIYTNWNTCIERALGIYIHILHDDDLVGAGFYHRLEIAFKTNPEIGAACCRHQHIDETGRRLKYISRLHRKKAGIIPNFIEKIAISSLFDPPAVTVKKEVYEHLGKFNAQMESSADHEMWIRIAVNYKVWFEPQVLAFYRVHNNTITSTVLSSGYNLVCARRVIQTFDRLLPSHLCWRLTKQALEECGKYGIKLAFRALSKGDLRTTCNQIREVLRSTHSLKVLSIILLVPWLAMLAFLWRAFRKIFVTIA